MNRVLKEAAKSRKRASITAHRYLPPKDDQVAAARAWGFAVVQFPGIGDVSSIYVDDVSKLKRTTNWPSNLPERAAMVRDLDYGLGTEDQVFFYSPLCVGFSEKHARDVIEAVWAKHHAVYVHSLEALYRKGDDLAGFFDLYGKELKTAQMRDYRSKKSN